jgi:hypothetical protein
VQFFDSVVRPIFARTKGIVYVLPETKLPSEVFASYEVDEPAQLHNPSRNLPEDATAATEIPPEQAGIRSAEQACED